MGLFLVLLESPTMSTTTDNRKRTNEVIFLSNIEIIHVLSCFLLKTCWKIGLFFCCDRSIKNSQYCFIIAFFKIEAQRLCFCSLEPGISSFTTTVTTTNSLSTSSPLQSINEPPPTYFVPPNCSNSSSIGSFCNISSQPCDIRKPCKNSGNCTNDPTRPQGYSCVCKSGFNGTKCESDIRPCQVNTCLHNGM